MIPILVKSLWSNVTLQLKKERSGLIYREHVVVLIYHRL